MSLATPGPGESARFSIQCGCGVRLSVPAQHAGKRLKCPTCGGFMVVPRPPANAADVRPSIAPPVPAQRLPPPTNTTPSGLNRRALIAVASAVAVAAMLCVLAIMWLSHSFHQERVMKANSRITIAAEVAGEWLQSSSPTNAEQIERELSQALTNTLATEKKDGESVLMQVRQRRQQLADQQKAVTEWKQAKRLIEENQIPEGIAIIKRCLEGLPIAEKDTAKSLLAEAEAAVSDDEAVGALSALPDVEFDHIKSGGELSDGKVTQPQLVAARRKTIQRNIPKAIEKRQNIRLAEIKKQEEAQAAEQRKKQEEAQAAAKTGPTPDVICRTANETLKIVESITRDDQGAYTSPYLGKVIKIENCWFNPTSSMYLERDKFKEGVDLMAFYQGGSEWIKGTRIGGLGSLYRADEKLTFYVDPDYAQRWKDSTDSFAVDRKKQGLRASTIDQYDFYFKIVNRKSTHRADGLTMPCAEYIEYDFSSARE